MSQHAHLKMILVNLLIYLHVLGVSSNTYHQCSIMHALPEYLNDDLEQLH